MQFGNSLRIKLFSSFHGELKNKNNKLFQSNSNKAIYSKA